MPDGEYHVGLILDADDVIVEFDETNNAVVERTAALTVGPTLEVSRLIRGAEANLTVHGAQAGEKVTFAVSLATGDGPCPMPGVCLDLVNPKVIGAELADAQGAATLNVTVPQSVPAGKTAWFQSVVHRGPASVVTNLDSETVQ